MSRSSVGSPCPRLPVCPLRSRKSLGSGGRHCRCVYWLSNTAAGGGTDRGSGLAAAAEGAWGGLTPLERSRSGDNAGTAEDRDLWKRRDVDVGTSVWEDRRLSGERLATAGKCFGFLSLQFWRKTRARRDERDVRKCRRSECENHPSTRSDGLRRASFQESFSCSVKPHDWQTHLLGHTSGGRPLENRQSRSRRAEGHTHPRPQGLSWYDTESLLASKRVALSAVTVRVRSWPSRGPPTVRPWRRRGKKCSPA